LEIGGRIPIDIDKDVDEFGNIIKEAGLNLPKNIPINNSMPDDMPSKGDFDDSFINGYFGKTYRNISAA